MGESIEEPILIDDPRVLSVPIEECGERLVDLRGYSLEATTEHPRATSPAKTRLHCRASVAERLLRADGALPEGTRLLVLECHRPLELQQEYWRRDLENLRERHPDWPEERLARENAKFVAPPWKVPPHSTGGAVDLVLISADGSELDMGSPLNGEGPLMRTDAEGISEEAKANRWLMLSAMQDAGFVNYGHEWWHYSHGDRYWAYQTSKPAAIYGTV